MGKEWSKSKGLCHIISTREIRTTIISTCFQNNCQDSTATSLILRLNKNVDDDAASSVCPANLAELIESKCSVQSASYMYQSVHLGEDTASVISTSNQSVLSANFTATLNASHE